MELSRFSKRKLELGAAVAALRGENVARKALRVDSDHGRFAAFQSAMPNGDCFILQPASFDAYDLEAAEARGQTSGSDDFRITCSLFALHVSQ